MGTKRLKREEGIFVKDKTMAYLFWISLGLVAVGLGIAVIWPIVQDALNDAKGKTPTIPTSMIEQKIDISETSLGFKTTV
jgi:hypothetical protein